MAVLHNARLGGVTFLGKATGSRTQKPCDAVVEIFQPDGSLLLGNTELSFAGIFE